LKDGLKLMTNGPGRKVEVDDERARAKVVANTVMSLKEATGKMIHRVVLALQRDLLTTAKLNQLKGPLPS